MVIANSCGSTTTFALKSLTKHCMSIKHEKGKQTLVLPLIFFTGKNNTITVLPLRKSHQSRKTGIIDTFCVSRDSTDVTLKHAAFIMHFQPRSQGPFLYLVEKGLWERGWINVSIVIPVTSRSFTPTSHFSAVWLHHGC